MGYRVEYEEERACRGTQKSRRGWLVMAGMWFLIFLLLVTLFWPAGADVLRECLIPGDAAVTAAALEDLARDVRGGTGLGEALKTFCQAILAGAELDFS